MKKNNLDFPCIGCGLCQSELGSGKKIDEKGFCITSFSEKQEKKIVGEFCPVAGKMSFSKDPWGSYTSIYSGFSTDAGIRLKASSGGALTALALFLIENKKVDGIIQTCVSEREPYETECIVSTSKDDILKCCGSRYSISSPWEKLKEYVVPEKKYAVIGKPCDITSLRSYAERTGEYSNIIYYLSFFCAGMPSLDAQKKLIKESGCPTEECKQISYRGNGWPGETLIIGADKSEYSLKYEYAWGKILGRDINPFCRVCMDGIGCFADIACGDGWYINNRQPDFSEHDGRNVIISRNNTGDVLLREAFEAGYISIAPWEKPEELKIIQRYQFSRRTTMFSKILAYKILFKKTPSYEMKTMKALAKEGTLKENLRVFLGTIKRIVKGKIK